MPAARPLLLLTLLACATVPLSATNIVRPSALYATFADGHREVLFCEAVLRSHRERRWVDVEY